MKRKNGFTLIELLAVIVILAIIALIATPLVLKYIEKSRKESKVDSAYSFVRNLETEIANYSIRNKGAKFNKAPISGDYYKFDDFTKDNGIDTTVKGDKPTDIKVCLSSLGQVEKAMFKYGKYYVSYDGKKGSISDEDSYNNFSCKTVADGGNDNQNDIYLYESKSTLEFAYDDEDGYYAMDSIDKSVFDKFEHGKEYELIIDDKTSIEVFCINNNGVYWIASDYSFDSENFVMIQLNESAIIMASYSELLMGNHTIKIKSVPETDNVSTFVVFEGNNSDSNNAVGDTVALTSTNFVDGNAHIIIKDDSDQLYFDGNVDLNDNDDGIYGVDTACRNNFDYIEGIYSAVSNGKKIIITVTQEISGQETTTTINADNFIDYSGGKLFGRAVSIMNSGC